MELLKLVGRLISMSIPVEGSCRVNQFSLDTRPELDVVIVVCSTNLGSMGVSFSEEVVR